MSKSNKSYELTPTQLRKFKGFETVTDEEALEVIFWLKELSQILYNIYSNKEQIEE